MTIAIYALTAIVFGALGFFGQRYVNRRWFK